MEYKITKWGRRKYKLEFRLKAIKKYGFIKSFDYCKWYKKIDAMTTTLRYIQDIRDEWIRRDADERFIEAAEKTVWSRMVDRQVALRYFEIKYGDDAWYKVLTEEDLHNYHTSDCRPSDVSNNTHNAT